MPDVTCGTNGQDAGDRTKPRSRLPGEVSLVSTRGALETQKGTAL
jgi:hypothetical protein